MIEFSANNFVKTLISIITGSPTSILFIVLGVIFTIAMIVNVKKNKTIGKSLFIIGWIFIILFVIIKYNGYLSKLFDNLINTVFRQIFFPNLATYIIIIIITNIIFLYTILNKKTKTLSKITNSIFFSLIMVLMVYTLDLIIKNKINVYEQEQLYTNEQVLTIIEASTIIFGLWILIIISKFSIKKLINKSNEKILKEFKNEETNTNEQAAKVETTPSAKPIEPIQPVETTPIAKPIEPIQPVETTPIAKPIEPIQQVEATPIAKPIEPIQPVETTPIVQPIEPVQPVETTPIAKPIEPVQQVEATPIAKPIEPVQPVETTPIIQVEQAPAIVSSNNQEPTNNENQINPNIFNQLPDNTIQPKVQNEEEVETLSLN